MGSQVQCPICGDRFIAEFYEPRGVALCLQCGTTFRRFRDRLIALGNLEPIQITPDTSFADDLKMDSLDVIELVMAMKEEGMQLSNAEASEIKTVEDALRFICAQRHDND